MLKATFDQKKKLIGLTFDTRLDSKANFLENLTFSVKSDNPETNLNKITCKAKEIKMSKNGKTMKITMDLDGYLPDGHILIGSKSKSSNPLQYYENDTLKFIEFPIEVKANFMYNTEREAQIQTAASTVKSTMTVLSVVSIPLSSTMGVLIIKNI